MGSNIDVELTALLKGSWTSAIEVDLPLAHFIGARSAISWSTSTSVIFACGHGMASRRPSSRFGNLAVVALVKVQKVVILDTFWIQL